MGPPNYELAAEKMFEAMPRVKPTKRLRDCGLHLEDEDEAEKYELRWTQERWDDYLWILVNLGIDSTWRTKIHDRMKELGGTPDHQSAALSEASRQVIQATGTGDAQPIETNLASHLCISSGASRFP